MYRKPLTVSILFSSVLTTNTESSVKLLVGWLPPLSPAYRRSYSAFHNNKESSLALIGREPWSVIVWDYKNDVICNDVQVNVRKAWRYGCEFSILLRQFNETKLVWNISWNFWGEISNEPVGLERKRDLSKVHAQFRIIFPSNLLKKCSALASQKRHNNSWCCDNLSFLLWLPLDLDFVELRFSFTREFSSLSIATNKRLIYKSLK